ncbi:unnamed protein product [Caenorhabditis sp. 36 PRJEB53466]|nr:unnamed protein product [Caenorhabditis sp. 36 PRJEB53466]
MDGLRQAKQMRRDYGDYDEEMEEEASSSSRTLAENNLVENFRLENDPSRSNGGNERTKKKLSIKNFKSRNNQGINIDQNNIDDTNGAVGKDWAVLSDNVHGILEDRKTVITMETLFNKVRAVCDREQAKSLYNRLVSIILKYAKRLKESMDEEEQMPLSEENCEDYLAKFGKFWETFPVKINLIRNIFLYLDRMILSSGDADLLPLWESSMQIYQKTFFPQLNNDFKSIKLFGAIYMAMNRKMQSYTVDTPLRSIVEMLQTIHAGDEFLDFMLARIREQYNKERLSNVPVMTCNEYMEYAEETLNQLGNMVKMAFENPSTLVSVQNTVLNCLIQQAIPEILTHEFDKLLDSGNVEHVRRMFHLCHQCPGGEEQVRAQFSKYMRLSGDKLVASCPNDDLVSELLAFKRKMDIIVKDSFKDASDQTKMKQCLADAFEHFVNKNVERAAELISKHFHVLLHSGNKNVTDELTLDQMVDESVVLFRYLRGKDVFEAYYKRGLSKRLFMERSASVDAEKMVLCKLKTECGAGFTYKLEGMFKDMDISENLSDLFEQHLEHSNKEKANFSVRVITPEYWPTYETFYRQQHGNRNVKWHHGLGTAVVSAEFRPNCKKELMGTLYQAVIILLFNKCDTWTVDEIVECTKIQPIEVVRNVLALLGGRDRPRILQKVLQNPTDKKESTVDSVKTETFTVNTGFTDRRCRVRITQVNIKTVAEEKKDVDKEVNQDRQYQIDAAVVRIMKARKELTHQELMNEVMAQLKFPLKAADVKVRIESLIERDYLSRDNDDASNYKYVA